MGGKDKRQSFVPYRSNVAYVPAAESPIVPLLDRLELNANRARWGYRLRFGLFTVSTHDMVLIATAMQADLYLLHF